MVELDRARSRNLHKLTLRRLGVGFVTQLLLAFSLLLPAPAMAADGDIALYKEVAARVHQGEPYYDSVADLHRKNGYPLKPFVTVRPPALAIATGVIGPLGLVTAAWAILLMGLAAWHRTLRARPLAERAGVPIFIAAGGSALISPSNLYIHELWAGLLLTLALGIPWNRKIQLAAATCAVLLRELSAPILGLLLYPFTRRQAVAIASVAAGVGAYYLVHMLSVSAVLVSSDPPSQGWLGVRGLEALSEDFSKMVGTYVPLWLALLPLVGWAFHRDALPFFWCAGVIFAVCVLARPDNLFWLLMLLPVYCAGVVFPISALLEFSKQRLPNPNDVNTLGTDT